MTKAIPILFAACLIGFFSSTACENEGTPGGRGGSGGANNEGGAQAGMTGSQGGSGGSNTGNGGIGGNNFVGNGGSGGSPNQGGHGGSISQGGAGGNQGGAGGNQGGAGGMGPQFALCPANAKDGDDCEPGRPCRLNDGEPTGLCACLVMQKKRICSDAPAPGSTKACAPTGVLCETLGEICVRDGKSCICGDSSDGKRLACP